MPELAAGLEVEVGEAGAEPVPAARRGRLLGYAGLLMLLAMMAAPYVVCAEASDTVRFGVLYPNLTTVIHEIAKRTGAYQRQNLNVVETRFKSGQTVEGVEQLWRGVGARLLRLSPAIHDDFVSRSSHLPHILAAQLANSVLSQNHSKQQAMLCANGFRDTTRIASGSPEMWRDIALANRQNLLRALESFTKDLDGFKRMLKGGDAKGVAGFFESAKRRRDRWSRQAASPSPE